MELEGGLRKAALQPSAGGQVLDGHGGAGTRESGSLQELTPPRHGSSIMVMPTEALLVEQGVLGGARGERCLWERAGQQGRDRTLEWPSEGAVAEAVLWKLALPVRLLTARQRDLPASRPCAGAPLAVSISGQWRRAA